MKAIAAILVTALVAGLLYAGLTYGLPLLPGGVLPIDAMTIFQIATLALLAGVLAAVVAPAKLGIKPQTKVKVINPFEVFTRKVQPAIRFSPERTITVSHPDRLKDAIPAEGGRFSTGLLDQDQGAALKIKVQASGYTIDAMREFVRRLNVHRIRVKHLILVSSRDDYVDYIDLEGPAILDMMRQAGSGSLGRFLPANENLRAQSLVQADALVELIERFAAASEEGKPFTAAVTEDATNYEAMETAIEGRSTSLIVLGRRHRSEIIGVVNMADVLRQLVVKPGGKSASAPAIEAAQGGPAGPGALPAPERPGIAGPSTPAPARETTDA